MLNVKFNYNIEGKVTTGEGVVARIGKGHLRPYEFLITALVSCYFSTFMEIIKKKNLLFEEFDVDVEYSKLEKKIPSYLESAKLDIKISGAKQEDFEELSQACKLASEFCSIYQTLSKKLGADLQWSLKLV